MMVIFLTFFEQFRFCDDKRGLPLGIFDGSYENFLTNFCGGERIGK